MTSKSSRSIVLFRGWDTPTSYVWSAFVTKLEFHLRLCKIPYTSAAGSPRTAPRGKIPYLELTSPVWPANPELLSDSTLIVRTFTARGIIPDINARLSSAQKAQDLALRALLEDKLSVFQIRERWINNYYTMRDHLMYMIPYPLRVFIGMLAYRANVRKLYDQGAGRFTDEESHAFRHEIWSGVAALLEDSRRDVPQDACFWVLGGKEPTEADSTVFGFVVSNLVSEAAPETTALLKEEFPVVVEYAERIHRMLFPDYDMWA